MKKLNKIALFALFLLVSVSVTAAEKSPLSYGAEIDGQRSLASFRQIIFRELVSNVHLQSPFIRIIMVYYRNVGDNMKLSE